MAVCPFKTWQKILINFNTSKIEENGGEGTRFARRSDTRFEESKAIPIQPCTAKKQKQLK